ncbi:single-stranded DNA-binding protein [Isoptericola nanjingensis]|uniref:single-stranded DNA-binding protein n=1 Tax=Isoptericola nanjingensis TaxID=903413 RepID=UPI003D1E9943
MTIPTHESLAGFIVNDADISFTDDGTTRAHFRVGVEHWHREDDGTFTQLDSSFHDLLLYGKTAERAADQFRKGDQFVAHGHATTFYAEPPARPAEREVFIARRIGHDLARTTYEVDRTHAPRQSVDSAPTPAAPTLESAGTSPSGDTRIARQAPSPPTPPSPVGTGAEAPAPQRSSSPGSRAIGL